MASGVDEDVIGVAARIKLGDGTSVSGGQCHQDRRAAEDDQDPMRLAVDRHREIRSRISHRQGSISHPGKLHDLDLTGIRHIDKGPGPGLSI